MVMYACNPKIQKTVIVRAAWNLKKKKEAIKEGKNAERKDR